MSDSGSADAARVPAEIEAHLHEAAQWQLGGDTSRASAAYRRVLALQPRHAGALHMLGVLATQAGEPERAAALISEAISIEPGQPSTHLNLGNALLALGRHREALASFERALELRPGYPMALLNRGITLIHVGEHEAAAASLLHAAGDRTLRVPALYNRAIALAHRGRLDEALADYDQVLLQAPEHHEAALNRAALLTTLDRPSEAISAYDRLLALRPAHVGALNDRGLVLLRLGQHALALQSFAAAVAADASMAHAHNNRGLALQHLGRPEEALLSVDQALRLNPQFPEALHNRGWILFSMARHEEAAAVLHQALALRPAFPQALTMLAAIAKLHERHAEALDYLNRALAIDPGFQDALATAGAVLCDTGRNGEAIDVFRRLLSVAPQREHALGELLMAQLHCCEWSEREALVAQIRDGVTQGRQHFKPLHLLAVADDPMLQLACARSYGTRQHSPVQKLPAMAPLAREGRLRLAYVSGDFGEHAVSYLMAGVFEHHDRSRFETLAISLRKPRSTATGMRLAKGFDRFEDLTLLDDRAAAARLRELQVHIAVDLSGYTGVGRAGIFAHRAAPLQVNYLGFPGTMGLPCMDYLLADEFTIPESARAHYAEAVVYLPHSFQANDDQRSIAASPIVRADAGLPEHALVLCSFNNPYKLNPAFFTVWMRVLTARPDALLWLLADDERTENNLRREAEERGIAAHRLCFARRLPYGEHLARLRLADLFLDSLPFNAGTTASDALWAGVPLLTCAGASFAGRMAGSLVRAVGLPELITTTLVDYETLALRLVREPGLLEGFRARLQANRLTAPLFDTKRFCRGLESAYSLMWERHDRGEAPHTFRVSP
jgi:predicted O-linked N-acetylglucosamine transferase (SPINDLY family)